MAGWTRDSVGRESCSAEGRMETEHEENGAKILDIFLLVTWLDQAED